jgi:hypothetical protein
MTRPGLVVDSHRRPMSWVIVAVSFLAYLGLLVAVGMAGLHLDVPLPWWLAQTAPPLLYALLVLVVVRPRSATSLCGGALLLWAVHLLLGMLTEPVLALLGDQGHSGTTWMFPPAPLPELLWVPVLLVPLRDLLRGAPLSRSANPQRAGGRQPVPSTRTPPFPAPAGRSPVERPVDTSATVGKPMFDKPPMAPTRPLGATTVTSKVTSMEPRLDAVRRPVMAAPAAPASGLAASNSARSGPEDRTSVAGAPAAAKPVEAAPSQTQRLTDELLAKETSDEPLRVSATRVLAQLPAEALAVPVDRLAAELGAQPFLLVPRRLALAQLSGGIVRVEWDLLAHQIPSHLLAMSHDAIKAGLPDGQCVLPLDEIVRQFSPEIFLTAGPAPDVRGIEVFSAPFQPLESRRSEIKAASEIEALPSPVVSAPVEPPLPDEIPGIVRAIAEPADSPADSVDVQHDADPVLAEPVPAVVPESLVRAPIPPVEEERAEHAAEGARRPWVEESVPTAERERPAAKPAHRESALQDDLHLLRGLTALLPAVGPLAVEVRVVSGVTLLSATSPAVDDEVAVTAAALLLPLMRPGRAPWPVDQVTLRGPRAVLILTPLGPLPAGGPVLAASVPPGGGVALLELRCRQAAVAHAARAAAPLDDGVASGEERDEPDLLDVEPSTRTREVASSFGALGTVTASSLRDPETDHALYLFLPPGSDVRAVGALAHDVSGVMRQAAEAGVTFRTAVLRSGARRVVIRLLAGHSNSIVAAGETAKPGLAYRQVEHAAAALGAL